MGKPLHVMGPSLLSTDLPQGIDTEAANVSHQPEASLRGVVAAWEEDLRVTPALTLPPLTLICPMPKVCGVLRKVSPELEAYSPRTKQRYLPLLSFFFLSAALGLNPGSHMYKVCLLLSPIPVLDGFSLQGFFTRFRQRKGRCL